MTTTTDNIESKFTLDELTEIAEIARIALWDAETFDYFADQLDLSDDYLQKLREKISKHLGFC